MFKTITNVKQREKFIRLLGLLVAAATVIPEGATAPVGFALLKKEDAEKMLAAEPSFISINPNIAPDAKGNVQVGAMPEGIAALQASQAIAAPVAGTVAAPAGSTAPVETATFTIQTDVPLPVIQRGGGGNRESKYPFAKLDVGNSFFVKSTPKAFASTISGQNRKGKGMTPPRKFTLRAVNEGGVQGVRVWRVGPAATPAV